MNLVTRNLTHTNVTCDACKLPSIVGYRFKCLSCIDYDLCAACYTCRTHAANHVFAIIDWPSNDRLWGRVLIPASSSPQCRLRPQAAIAIAEHFEMTTSAHSPLGFLLCLKALQRIVNETNGRAALDQLVDALDADVVSSAPLPFIGLANAEWIVDNTNGVIVKQARSSAELCAAGDQWAAEASDNRVCSLELPSLTHIVVASIVTFDRTWEPVSLFKPHQMMFTDHSYTTSLVASISTTNDTQLAYYQSDKAQAVRLPYSGGAYAILVLPPQDITCRVADALAIATAYTDTWQPHMCSVSMPTLAVHANHNITQMLAMSSVSALVSPAALRWRLDDDTAIVVTQTVDIDVNVRGTSVLAVTKHATFAFGAAAAPSTTKHIYANRPFFFFVFDQYKAMIVAMHVQKLTK